MSVPSTWILAWAGSVGLGTERQGKAYEAAYIAPAGTTLAVAESVVPYGTYYPGQSGDWGARCRYATVRPNLETDQVSVTYRYESATVEEILVDHQNYVRVDAEGTSVSYRPVKDLDGQWIWHTERDEIGSASKKWEPVSGTGIREEGRTLYRVRLVKPYDFQQNLIAYQNTVNAGNYAQFGNLRYPAGTMRFVQWARRRAPTVDRLYVYDALVEGRNGYWNQETAVQKYEYRTYQVQRRQADGTLIDGQYDTIADWYPTIDPPYYAKNYASHDWTLILGVYDW